MNKLGLHIIGGWPGNLGKPRLVKLVDVSVEYVAQVRAAVGPDCLIIVRSVQGAQPLDNPAARAQQFVARYQSAMLAMKQAAGPNIAFESYNEIADTEAAAYCAFEAERLRLMHGLGLRSVVGNWSVGTPDLPVWATYRPMLSTMHPGDLVGLHEYWVDTADINNRWHCGRWTKAPELAGKPIVITECGRDMVEGRGASGWRRTCDAATFFRDLETYNALLEQHANVVGATVFTTPGPGGGWADFDPTPVWPQVVARYTTTAPVTPPPVYTPEKVTASGVKYVDWYKTPHWSGRHSYKVLAIVVHSPDRSPLGSVQSVLDWLANSTSKVSAHDVIGTDGTVYRCVGYDRAAWHCGGSTIPGIPAGSVDGTSIVNFATIGIELDHSWLPGESYPEAQLAAAAEHIKALCDRYGISRDRVYRHGDIDSRKVDPRDLSGEAWQRFLDRIWGSARNDLPRDETATDAATLADKIRWWTEEAVRQHHAGKDARAWSIITDLIDQEHGLMYRLERALKAAR